jgi:hypothetical protein
MELFLRASASSAISGRQRPMKQYSPSTSERKLDSVLCVLRLCVPLGSKDCLIFKGPTEPSPSESLLWIPHKTYQISQNRKLM